MRLRFISLLLMLCCLLCQVVYAEKVPYQISYAPKASVKGPSLKQATLVLQIYLHGKTQTKLTVTTDDKDQFELDTDNQKGLIVEVLSIQNAPRNMHCHGVTAIPGDTKILLHCDVVTRRRFR